MRRKPRVAPLTFPNPGEAGQATPSVSQAELCESESHTLLQHHKRVLLTILMIIHSHFVKTEINQYLCEPLS